MMQIVRRLKHHLLHRAVVFAWRHQSALGASVMDHNHIPCHVSGSETQLLETPLLQLTPDVLLGEFNLLLKVNSTFSFCGRISSHLDALLDSLGVCVVLLKVLLLCEGDFLQ